ncbi:Formyltransferase [Peniophora sp. CONT]|nr:Formyltransferase [Peniophora sp. CONT]
MLLAQHQYRPFLCFRRHFHARSQREHKHDPFRVLFFGRDEFSCAILKRLHDEPALCKSITIATTPDIYIGRNRDILSVSPLKTLGKSLGIDVLEMPRSRAEVKAWLPPKPFLSESSAPPLSNVLVTASFGRILPGSLLRLFDPARRLNCHPSALPAYRGPAPIQRALLNCEAQTAVSVIEMTEVLRKAEREKRTDGSGDIDSGGIWDTQPFDIAADRDFAMLRDELASASGELLVSVLHRMRSGELRAPTPQAPPDADTPRASLILPEDALVHFDRFDAQTILRRHRAIAHHKPLTAVLANGKHVQLHDMYVCADTQADLPPGSGYFDANATNASDLSGERVLIVCANGTALAVRSLKTESKRLLDARSWFIGTPTERVNRKVVRFVTPPEDAFARHH